MSEVTKENYQVFNSADDFIQRYIIDLDCTKYNFVASTPYIKYNGVCLDISDNNMLQEFVLIENTNITEVQTKIVNYF